MVNKTQMDEMCCNP